MRSAFVKFTFPGRTHALLAGIKENEQRVNAYRKTIILKDTN